MICVGPSVQSAYSPNMRGSSTNAFGQTSSAPAITASAQPPTKLQVGGKGSSAKQRKGMSQPPGCAGSGAQWQPSASVHCASDMPLQLRSHSSESDEQHVRTTRSVMLPQPVMHVAAPRHGGKVQVVVAVLTVPPAAASKNVCARHRCSVRGPCQHRHRQCAGRGKPAGTGPCTPCSGPERRRTDPGSRQSTHRPKHTTRPARISAAKTILRDKNTFRDKPGRTSRNRCKSRRPACTAR